MILMLFFCFSSAQITETAENVVSGINNTGTVKFKVYILVQGGLVKKPVMPVFAYRQPKVYPVKAREFLKISKYHPYTSKEFKGKAESIIQYMTQNMKKNAVQVAGEVFNYINLSITTSDENARAGSTYLDCFAMPLDVMLAGKGNNIEKCRLAVAMLRYFNIPARTAFWNDRYVVQYFLKPLESEKIEQAWYIMDFTGLYGQITDGIEPVAWHPVKAQELLGVNWEHGNIALSIDGVKNTRMEINESEALALFTNIERGNMPDTEGNTGLSRYYLLKEISCTMIIPDKQKKINIEIILPFNESQPFKTLKYYVLPGVNMKAKFKNTHTMVNPPNSGLVYTLPVEFELY